MTLSDNQIILGELVGGFAIGIALGFIIALFIMAGKTITK